jgi:hypothetical protein
MWEPQPPGTLTARPGIALPLLSFTAQTAWSLLCLINAVSLP